MDKKTRQKAVEFTAERLGLGDPEAEWSASIGEDGNVRFERLWRVTDAHTIEGKFLVSTEAHKLHGLASLHAETYARPAALVKVSVETEGANSEADGEDTSVPTDSYSDH